MNRKLKNTIKILSPLILITLITAIILIGHNKYHNQTCEKINIQILNPNIKFITQKEAINYLHTHFKEKIIGQKMQKIDFPGIEKILLQNPYVKDAEAQYYSDNTVLIKILQYKPVLKIYTSGANFYIDQDGTIFPEKPGYAYYTIIANGKIKIPKDFIRQKININQLEKKRYSSIYSLYTVAKYINSDNFWKKFFSQIYLKDEKTIILIPRIGDFVIILGDAMNLQEKFRNLRAFLDNMDKIGWDKYSAINLSYKNQIVCTKK